LKPASSQCEERNGFYDSWNLLFTAGIISIVAVFWLFIFFIIGVVGRACSNKFWNAQILFYTLFIIYNYSIVLFLVGLFLWVSRSL